MMITNQTKDLQALDYLRGVRNGQVVQWGRRLQPHQVDNEEISLVVLAQPIEVACVHDT